MQQTRSLGKNTVKTGTASIAVIIDSHFNESINAQYSLIKPACIGLELKNLSRQERRAINNNSYTSRLFRALQGKSKAELGDQNNIVESWDNDS